MISTENAFFSNRSLWMLIAGGVFDRFPDLRAAWVETQVHLVDPDDQLPRQGRERATGWGSGRSSRRSSACRASTSGRNVFVGLSPFSPRQDPTGDVLGKDAEGRDRPGFHVGAGALMYGVDFPHFETCFQRNMGEVATLVATPVLTEDRSARTSCSTPRRTSTASTSTRSGPHIDRVGFDVGDVRARRRDRAASCPSSTSVTSPAAWAASAGDRRSGYPGLRIAEEHGRTSIVFAVTGTVARVTGPCGCPTGTRTR